MDPHPLRALLEDAARSRFPPADGTIRVLPSPPGPSDAVVAFTAHHLIAADVGASEVDDHLPGADLGGPMSAGFLHWLVERIGTEAGSLDLVLAAPGLGATTDAGLLRETVDVIHERVTRADRYRDEIRTFVTPERDGVLVLGRGLARRSEVSLEIDEAARGRGLGRRMIVAARSLVPPGEALFAQVAPGNAASLRAFLAAGFVPIGSEVLFPRPG